MLLCGVVEKIKPLGKDMWDDVTTSYNTSRTKLWVERDSESPRRRFCNLYRKPKPTGWNGATSLRIQSALWAKEFQFSIVSSGGAHTAHDDLDDGDDDGYLDEAVSTATVKNPTHASPAASNENPTQVPPPTSHTEVGEVDHDRQSEE
ncbi:hypothetical protein PHMEG_0005217 [Phytophthora megakarya]|uniref:DUF6818 domain-containing protein n=1 Tax=Phytophthora megakarya TaxID=4795 RepID=A0A225WTE4_9STRA|nr:hypothetical protein PHMEG_0005217 [Phytophthora megakarya]